MLVDFFLKLRDAAIPVSITEYLSLLDALDEDVCGFEVEDFYHLSRAALVKDERHFDRFDLVFGAHFKGVEMLFDGVAGEIPLEWLRKLAERNLSKEEKALVESLGGWDKLMETLRKRLAEQRKRHQGGSKWIGTAGTSPYGAYGYNPEGRPHRPGRLAQPPRRQGLGPARVPGLRRHHRNRHPELQGGATPPAAVRSGRGRRRAGPGRHDPLDRPQRRAARCSHGSRTAQRGTGPALPRRRWLDE